MEDQENLTVEQKIVAHLDSNGQMLTWLAKQIKCTAGHLHLVLKMPSDHKDKRELTVKNRAAINKVLKTNF